MIKSMRIASHWLFSRKLFKKLKKKHEKAEKEELVQRAKFVEQTKRLKDMGSNMKSEIETGIKLFNLEHN